MAHKFQAIRRTTHRYEPSFAYLDQAETLDFTVKVVTGKYRPREEYDGADRLPIFVTASRPVTEDEINAVLRYEYDRGGCTHDYDCCGCLHGGVRNLRRASRNGRRWVARLSYTPNY